MAGKPPVKNGDEAAVALSASLQPPKEFPFPFEAYDIQKAFMRRLYQSLEDGSVGIFESPTGTVSTGSFQAHV